MLLLLLLLQTEIPSVPITLVIAGLSGLVSATSVYFLGRIDGMDRLSGLRRWIEDNYVPRKEIDSEFKRLLDKIEIVDDRRQEQFGQHINLVERSLEIAENNRRMLEQLVAAQNKQVRKERPSDPGNGSK